MTIIKIYEVIKPYNTGSIPYRDTDRQYWPLVKFLHEILPWVEPEFSIPDIAPNKMKLFKKEIDPWHSIREIYRWGKKQAAGLKVRRRPHRETSPSPCYGDFAPPGDTARPPGMRPLPADYWKRRSLMRAALPRSLRK